MTAEQLVTRLLVDLENEEHHEPETLPMVKSVPIPSIKELAQEALDVQSAVNLPAVVHSFSRALSKLREIAQSEGWDNTDQIKQHPISVLYSSKIASLTQSEDGLEFYKAYTAANEWIK